MTSECAAGANSDIANWPADLRPSRFNVQPVTERTPAGSKPKLLVLELWGIGDLIIASPFLREACRRYQVTLLAQGYANELRPFFWPEVRVVPFRMPWTVHRGKYRLHTWPWPRLLRLLGQLRSEHFDAAVSARWDPRDDSVMWLAGARQRIGFPRMGSRVLETDPLERPDPTSHRHERWRVIGTALGLDVPSLSRTVQPVCRRNGIILVHSGAGKVLRVWPLERFHGIVRRLRALGHRVSVACDPDHVAWWREHGEPEVVAPTSLDQLMSLANQAGMFIGNDSGPGHVAGYLGIPTFTLFGPQVPEWFVPLHPEAEWIEGSPCPYRPCFDYCEFPDPFCLTGITEDQAWKRLRVFVEKHLDVPTVR